MMLMSANNRIHHGPIVVLFVCTLSNIIIIQPYLKVLNVLIAYQVHSVEFVSRNKSILSIIFHAIYGAVCIQLTHSSYDDFQNICTSS